MLCMQQAVPEASLFDMMYTQMYILITSSCPNLQDLVLDNHTDFRRHVATVVNVPSYETY